MLNPGVVYTGMDTSISVGVTAEVSDLDRVRELLSCCNIMTEYCTMGADTVLIVLLNHAGFQSLSKLKHMHIMCDYLLRCICHTYLQIRSEGPSGSFLYIDN